MNEQVVSMCVFPLQWACWDCLSGGLGRNSSEKTWRNSKLLMGRRWSRSVGWRKMSFQKCPDWQMGYLIGMSFLSWCSFCRTLWTPCSTSWWNTLRLTTMTSSCLMHWWVAVWVFTQQMLECVWLNVWVNILALVEQPAFFWKTAGVQ